MMQVRNLGVWSLCITLTLGFSLCWGLAYAKIEHRTVECTGTGITLNGAINDALDEAVGRINGKSIETKKQLESIEMTMGDSVSEEFFTGEAYKNSIKTATKGVVSGYDILSKLIDQDGLWSVTLRVQVVKYVAKNSNRKRLAVLPLLTSGDHYSIDGEIVDKGKISRVLTQNVISCLVQSRRFTVLDREYIGTIAGERALVFRDGAPAEEMARLGQTLVADYVMTGVVERLGYEEKSVRMQSSGRELISREGYAEVGVRLIDVATRQIVFSDFLKIRIKEKDLQRYGGSSRDAGVESAMAMVVADRVGHKVLEAIYPVLVVSVRNKEVTLGQGGSQLKRGDLLDVFMYGERLIDPYTKEFIGREETYVGNIEVTRVNAKQTQARIIKSEMDLAENFQPKKFVCRAMQDAPDRIEKERKRRKAERAERRVKRDDNW